MRLLTTQMADGAGSTVHGLLIDLYALQTAGIGGYAGLMVSGQVGVGLAAVATSLASTRLAGPRLVRAAVIVLVVSRMAAYGCIALGADVEVLALLRVFSAASGTVAVSGVRSQTPAQSRVADLARGTVAAAAGRTVGALVAASISATGIVGLVVGVGSAAVVASAVPIWRSAPQAVTRPLGLRDQVAALRVAAVPMCLGAAALAIAGSLPLMRDGLAVQWHGPAWVGAATGAALVGSVAAAWWLRQHPPVRLPLWQLPLIPAVPTAAWALAPASPALLLAAVAASAAAATLVACRVEGRVMDLVDPSATVAASVVGQALGSASMALTVPLLSARMAADGGQDAVPAVAMALAGLALVALVACVGPALAGRRRRVRAEASGSASSAPSAEVVGSAAAAPVRVPTRRLGRRVPGRAPARAWARTSGRILGRTRAQAPRRAWAGVRADAATGRVARVVQVARVARVARTRRPAELVDLTGPADVRQPEAVLPVR